jgi:hypothetical protein
MSNPKSKMAQIDQMEKKKHQQIQTLSDKIDAQNFKTMGIKQQCFQGTCLNLPQTYVYLQVKQKCPDMGLMYKNNTIIDDEGSINCEGRGRQGYMTDPFNGLQFCPKKRSSLERNKFFSEREKAYAACRAKVPFLQ